MVEGFLVIKRLAERWEKGDLDVIWDTAAGGPCVGRRVGTILWCRFFFLVWRRDWIVLQ